MITFLNDKEDKSLRGSFFDCIVGVAAFVGWQCSDILIPLLQQGLTDSEEFVIAKSIRATTALTELGLIQKTALSEFISDCAPYLNHPNLWIRHEICGLISIAAKTFGAIDVQCKLMPAISNHLKQSLIQVEKPEILLDCLQVPIPRNIFDSVVRFPHLEQLIKILHERREARTRVNEGVLPQYGEMNRSVQNVSQLLSISQGANPLTLIRICFSVLSSLVVRRAHRIDRNTVAVSKVLFAEIEQIFAKGQSQQVSNKWQSDGRSKVWHLSGICDDGQKQFAKHSTEEIRH